MKLQENKDICWVKGCGCRATDTHEVFFGTANRKKSIKDNMQIRLCPIHHNTNSSKSIHNDRELDLQAKKYAQQVWEETYGTRDDFIRRYGKSWL